jgi:hypothetical protein
MAKRKPNKKPKKKHPKVWENMTVSMQYAWGTVSTLFRPPSKPPARFKLVPFMEADLKSKKVRRLQVTFTDGCLKPNWRRMIFDTFGTKAPPPVASLLPKWKDTQAVRDAYKQRLAPVMALLKARKCRVERIQGRYEYIKKKTDDINRFYYRIRAAYLPGCVDAGGGKRTDLVVFVAKAEGGGPAPDGGGTGPPKIP